MELLWHSCVFCYKQGAPNGANICYDVLSCYKQVAPDGAHACPRENGELINFSKDYY